jgi:hypothetical protein
MFDHLRSTDCSQGATKGVVRGHFVVHIIAKKILDARYWWPTLFKDTREFCRSCDSC